MQDIPDLIIALSDKIQSLRSNNEELNKLLDEADIKNKELNLWHTEEVKHTTKLMTYIIYLQDLLNKNEINYESFKG